jgi:hypothetical protein
MIAAVCMTVVVFDLAAKHADTNAFVLLRQS